MTNGLVGCPTIGDSLRVAQFTSRVSIEVCTKVRLKAVHFGENRIEWISCDFIVVEKPNLSARVSILVVCNLIQDLGSLRQNIQQRFPSFKRSLGVHKRIIVKGILQAKNRPNFTRHRFIGI